MTNPLLICVGVESYEPWLLLGTASLRDFVFKCLDLGFTAIELCDRTITSTETFYLKQMQAFFRREGVTVPCLDVRNDFTVKDADEWEANVQHVLKWIRAADQMSVPIVRIWAGVRSVDHEAPNRVLRAVERIVPVAERYGVLLAMENHGRVSSNPYWLARLVRFIDSAYFGTCPDFGHLAADERYDGLAQLIPLSFHIHAKTYGFRDDGEETEMDYSRILSMIGKLTRPVYLSIEYKGETRSVRDNVAGIVKTDALIKKHWPVKQYWKQAEVARAL
jgi:sugar phosphate isomerase/epimerase